MQRILNSHPQIYCTERRMFGEYADFIYDDGNTTPRLRITLDKFVSASLSHLNLPNSMRNTMIFRFLKQEQKMERAYSGKHILVDKITPYNGTSEIVANQINRFFPKSGLIYLLRDGRDVTTSGVFHWFNKESENAQTSDFKNRRKLAVENDNLAKIGRFFSDEEIEEWALTWAEPLRTVSFMKKSKHPICFVRYENMIADQKSELKSIFSFLGGKINQTNIERSIKNSSFKKMTGNRSRGNEQATHHIRKGVVGDWKNYFTKKDGELFHNLAGKELLEFGYEDNPKWYESLPDTFAVNQ